MFVSTGGINLPTNGDQVKITPAQFEVGEYNILLQNVGTVTVHVGPDGGTGPSSYALPAGKDLRLPLDGDALFVAQAAGSTAATVTALVWTT